MISYAPEPDVSLQNTIKDDGSAHILILLQVIPAPYTNRRRISREKGRSARARTLA